MNALRVDEIERYPDGRVGYRIAVGEEGKLPAKGKRVLVFGSQAEVDDFVARQFQLSDHELLFRALAKANRHEDVVGVEIKSVEKK